jgi:cysteine-rich repeat protein
MKLVGRLALFAVFGVATSASAIVISGGPSTLPFGGGSCAVTTQATCNGSPCSAPDGTGGVTLTCSGLNVGAGGLRHLYYGINNAPSVGNDPNGDSMQGVQPSGTEVFRFASITGANQINYSGTTKIDNAQTNTLSSVSETNVIAFQAGTGSLVTDATITGLNNANGDVSYLWDITSNSFTTTVNVKAGGNNAIPTVFNVSHTPPGTQEIDHVNLAFYWDTCGNGTMEGAEQCDDGPNNGTAGDCCDADCNFVPATTTCRPPAGPCDIAENCTGSSAACPADAFAASTVPCRPSTGICDPAENCTGVSPACPADIFLPSTTVCRAAAGECDVAESCTGTAGACPADQKKPNATACTDDGNPCTLDQCDGASDPCHHPAGNAGTPCRTSAGICDVAENCDGASTTCPSDGFASTSTVCRSAAGACDVAETCTGTSAACPSDSLVPASTVCRAAAGACDAAESCSGTSADCPPDSVMGAFVTCRPSTGPCDQAENCTGFSPACPADAFKPSTTTCRAAAGDCDVAETCTGTDAACPADALRPSTATCRAAVDTCDVAESCTGFTTSCPPDLKAPDGTSCDDANSCTVSDSCQSGVCTGSPSGTPSCGDHYLCYKVQGGALNPGLAVHLVDEFEDVTATSLKARQLCTPASQDGSLVSDATTHLVAYSFRQSTRHTKRTVSTVDQFGTLSLTTTKPDTLLVPTNKNLSTTPPAPDENAINVDHYKCYKVKITHGTPKFPKGVQATVGDQFAAPPKTFLVQKPRHLCNPVNKNGEGIKNANSHFVCYQVRAANGQPKHVRRSLFTNNQFGPGAMVTIKERELCVPLL